ncbi:MAG: ABC transporter substrate-binding protein, partial [Lachnospiraceae bacterium]|nr:ABC transporter substrate-binding protein [Lachnospiraceae bacterium]
YADSMFEMAKYTKDVEAYKLGVIDVRRKNAEVIAHGQEALKVLIQTRPLPEGSLLPEADDDSVMETPDQAKTDSVSDSAESRTAETTVDSSASQAAESGTDSNVSQAAESETDSILDQMTESALDSSAESYPADAEKVADKRESITVLLMRVDAEGCTIQGSHDYVSNMFADFGLINVNPGYEEVRVTLPKEDAESDSAAKVEEIQEADSQPAEGTGADSTVESEAAVDSQPEEGAETDSAVESGAGADSQASGGTEVDSSVDADAQTADSQATDGQVTDSKATGSEEAADQAKVRPANEIEFENILSRNPDYIFVIYEGKEKTAEKTYKEICESREFWGNMTAVRNRHVYTLPQSTFAYPPNDQWDLAYEYLYQMMFVM